MRSWMRPNSRGTWTSRIFLHERLRNGFCPTVIREGGRRVAEVDERVAHVDVVGEDRAPPLRLGRRLCEQRLVDRERAAVPVERAPRIAHHDERQSEPHV